MLGILLKSSGVFFLYKYNKRLIFSTREKKKIIKRFSLGLVQKSQKCFLLVIKQQNMFFDHHAICLEACGPSTMRKSSRPRNTFYAFSIVNSLPVLLLFLLVSFKKNHFISHLPTSHSSLSVVSYFYPFHYFCSNNVLFSLTLFFNHVHLKLYLYFYSNLLLPLIV